MNENMFRNVLLLRNISGKRNTSPKRQREKDLSCIIQPHLRISCVFHCEEHISNILILVIKS